jgi:hypothetical protein
MPLIGASGTTQGSMAVESEHLNDYAPVLARAEALIAEHDACLIDRSDKDSGYLLSTLGN